MKKILSLLLVSLTFLACFNAKAEENNMTNKKVLVAYFSATGTTAGVAERLVTATGGDLFEIRAEQP